MHAGQDALVNALRQMRKVMDDPTWNQVITHDLYAIVEGQPTLVNYDPYTWLRIKSLLVEVNAEELDAVIKQAVQG